MFVMVCFENWTMNVRMGKGFRFLLIALPLLQWLYCAPSFAALRSSPPTFPSVFLLNTLPLFSDFDGDNKLDQATLSSNGRFKSVHIAFGGAAWSSLSFDSDEPQRGSLVSGDIDDDGDIDLVWFSQNADKFVAWMGDGRGNFSTGTNVRVNVERLRSLLEDGASRIRTNGNATEPTAILLDANSLLPSGNGVHPYLSAQGSLVSTDTPDVRSPCFSLLKQRGPPSRLS